MSARRRRSTAPRSTAAIPHLRPSVLALVFLIVAFIAFGPAMSAPFDFDDGPAIVANVTIRRLWPPTAPLHTPSLGTAVSGRPVANYSFALNYALNSWLGVEQTPNDHAPHQTIGYHVVNIVLHAVAALLLFALVRRTLQFGRVPDAWRSAADRVALIVAGLWLIHPIQTDAVDYVSQRTELLVSLCYLAALYASLRAWLAHLEPAGALANVEGVRPTARRVLRWSAVAVLASLVGMGSKEVMLSAPLIVPLYDRAFLATRWRDLWAVTARRRLYAALAATSVLSLWLIAAGARAETVGFHLGLTWYQYLYSQAWAISHYLTLIVWPDGLTIDYGQSPIRGLAGVPGLIGLTAIGIATLAAWWRDQWRWLGFLGAWFFLLLAPSSSVVPISTEIAAERRIYLASAAVFMLIAVGAELAWRRMSAERAGTGGRTSWARIAIGACVGVILVGATMQRSSLYTNSLGLWQDAIAKVPGNARAYDNLAAAELRQDPPRLAVADSLLDRAIALDSTFVPALVRSAAVAIKQTRLARADTLLEQALRVSPLDSAATEKLGKVLLAMGESDRALPYLRRTAAFSPNSESLGDLGVAYLSVGLLDSAVFVLQRSVALAPERVDALRYLGGALIEAQRGPEAVPYLVKAAQREPDSGFNLALLSVAYAQSGHPELAEQAASEAVLRAPTEAAVYVFAGRALQTVGQSAGAADYLTRAVRLAPNDPQALTRLGIANAKLGNLSEAVRLFEKALVLAPEYPLARMSLDDVRHRRSR